MTPAAPALGIPAHALRNRVRRIIHATTEAVIAEELGVESLEGVPFVDETATILERRMFGMQSYMAAGLAGLTLAFDASTVPRRGRRFHALSLSDRRQVLAGVGAVQLGLVNNFAAFYQKLGAFIFWSLLEEHGRLDVGIGAQAAGLPGGHSAKVRR